jgi:hypothetical protein
MVGCDAEASYYGIGRAADFVAARRCAFAQISNKEESIFGGEDILMMIYANGKGVHANLTVAMTVAFGWP